MQTARTPSPWRQAKSPSPSSPSTNRYTNPLSKMSAAKPVATKHTAVPQHHHSLAVILSCLVQTKRSSAATKKASSAAQGTLRSSPDHYFDKAIHRMDKRMPGHSPPNGQKKVAVSKPVLPSPSCRSSTRALANHSIAKD